MESDHAIAAGEHTPGPRQGPRRSTPPRVPELSGDMFTMSTAATQTTIDPAVAQGVRAFIVENFLLGQDSGFDNGESLLETGIIDSTGIMHVVAFLEERFGIAVEDDDLVADNLDSIERIAGFIGRKQALKTAA